MTSPFQSIIGTPENAVEDQVERNECNSYSEEVAEIAAISIAPKELPFGLSELSAGIETGICAAPEKVSEFDRAATAATQTAAGRRLQ